MQVKAQHKYLRIGQKKIKALARLTVGLAPQEAIDRLLLVGNKGAKMLSKVISSAAANAKNNLKQEEDKLKIQSVEVLKGPILKRWQPVSRGTAHQIKKRMSHIKVTLEEAHGQKS